MSCHHTTGGCGRGGSCRSTSVQGKPEAPAAPAWAGLALQPTNDRMAAAGIEIDANTATPSWRGERLDLDYAMSVLWRRRREPPAE